MPEFHFFPKDRYQEILEARLGRRRSVRRMSEEERLILETEALKKAQERLGVQPPRNADEMRVEGSHRVQEVIKSDFVSGGLKPLRDEKRARREKWRKRIQSTVGFIPGLVNKVINTGADKLELMGVGVTHAGQQMIKYPELAREGVELIGQDVQRAREWLVQATTEAGQKLDELCLKIYGRIPEIRVGKKVKRAIVWLLMGGAVLIAGYQTFGKKGSEQKKDRYADASSAPDKDLKLPESGEKVALLPGLDVPDFEIDSAESVNRVVEAETDSVNKVFKCVLGTIGTSDSETISQQFVWFINVLEGDSALSQTPMTNGAARRRIQELWDAYRQNSETFSHGVLLGQLVDPNSAQPFTANWNDPDFFLRHISK